MKKTIKKFLIFTLSASFLLSCTTGAFAYNADNFFDDINHQDNSNGAYSKDSVLSSDEQENFVNKIQLLVDSGTLTASEARDTAIAEGIDKEFYKNRANIDFPNSRMTNTSHVSQGLVSHYCGPASGTMIARQWGMTTDLSEMARLMQTDTYGVTNWGRKQFTNGLNAKLGQNFYTQHNSPSLTSLIGAFQSTVGHYNHPIAANMVEFENSSHYNGHPNRTIGHWIVGYGYTQNGSYNYWHDPADQLFTNAQPTFSDSAANMHKYTQQNGIAF